MSERVITITIHEGNDFVIQEGDRFCDRLCWDEMLGSIAELTHPSIGTCRYRMQTKEEWDERERKHQERLASLSEESQ